MIKDIIVFGDSFMYAHETNYVNFVNNKDFNTKFKKATGSDFVQHTQGELSGRVKIKDNSVWFKFLKDMSTDEKKECNARSIGNVLASKLDVPCSNHAVNGSSNNTIFYKVIEKLHKINKGTLVICGITAPTRKSYYQNHWQPEAGTITSMNSFVQNHKDLEKYQLLDLELGNDSTALVLETFAYMRAIIQLVIAKGANLVFVDPMNNFSKDIWHDGKSFNYIKDSLDESINYQHNQILDTIDMHIKPTMAPGFCDAFKNIDNNKLYRYCPGGHYSAELYKEYVDSQLIPYLENINVLP